MIIQTKSLIFHAFFFEIITACYYFGRRLNFDVHSQSLRLIRNIKNGNVLFKSILVFFPF
jgi:hypothetical protein